MASTGSSEKDDIFIGAQDIKTKLDDEDTRFGTENEIRLVLIGRTGNGKSATGNSILNKKGYFPSKVSSQSITNKCRKGEVSRDGKNVIVVDSPGLFDTKELSENVKKEITKCIAVSSPGPHAILYVLSCRNRFTKEEEDTFIEMITIFGDNLYKHIIFVFTALDDIHADNTTFEEFLKGCEGFIKILFEKCENRVLTFNNRVSDDAENERQLKPLFDMITKMKGKAAQFYYQHKMIEETEDMIREEIKRIIEEKKLKGEKYDEVAIRAVIRSQIRDAILREESIFVRIKVMLFSKHIVALVGAVVGAAVTRACTVM